MTIIFLSRYQGKVERGVENYVEELASRLKKYHRVEVLTSVKELCGKRPEIVYPLNGGLQALFCRVYCWLVGAKLVLGGHAGIGRDDRWNLYLTPDIFVALTTKGDDWAGKVAPWVRRVKIPYGVDLARFNPQVKPRKVALQRPIFICVSQLVPYKRVGETVKAVAKLKKGSLLVLGEGPEEDRVDAWGRRLLGVTRYRRLKTSHNVVASYLVGADVFTLASRPSEAFGLVYLEALACNLPVVATDDSSRREIVGPAGLFVDRPENSGEYARLLEQAARRDWGTAPRKRAEKFGWEKILPEYLTLFKRLRLGE